MESGMSGPPGRTAVFPVEVVLHADSVNVMILNQPMEERNVKVKLSMWNPALLTCVPVSHSSFC